MPLARPADRDGTLNMVLSVLSNVHCVVFDIDDTLYLERDYVRSGFLAVEGIVAERFAARGFADQAWAAFERGVRGTIFNECLPNAASRRPRPTSPS